MPLNIEITDADIESIALLMRRCFNEENRRRALKCRTSRDIQACPGSGKTTLLVAKIAILASKWNWRDRGICVLSHTNVARQEIQQRLAHHPRAHNLLNYPHFIGTIQAFVDKFLALPFLRDQGKEVLIIDDDLFAERALKLINFPRFATAFAYLQKKYNYKDIVASLTFDLKDEITKIYSTAGDLPKETTKTYQDLLNLKKTLAADGLYRFDDMYCFAQAQLLAHPHLIDVFRIRFPWVFVDEMQDTDSIQDRLIEKIFGQECILQKFGDSNQAIYGSRSGIDDETTFPKSGFINLPQSLRFGAEIAAFATPLSGVSPQKLEGIAVYEKRRHTIFLFDDGSVLDVLPAYAQLLLNEFQGNIPENFVAKAVGFRKAGIGSSDGKIPYILADYWPSFRAHLQSLITHPSHFIHFIRRARHIRADREECKEAYDVTVDGILQFLNSQGVRDTSGKRFQKTNLIAELREQNRLIRLNTFILELCLSRQPLSSEVWDRATQEFLDIFHPWTGAELTTEGNVFLEFCEVPFQVAGEENSLPTNERLNLYRHIGESGTVEIEVATIHSVKGETHTATLVLDTYLYQKHDLAELLIFLKKNCEPKSAIQNNRLKERMKRVYVAMTRPKELLCLAIHRRYLREEDADTLKKYGWTIQDLTL